MRAVLYDGGVAVGLISGKPADIATHAEAEGLVAVEVGPDVLRVEDAPPFEGGGD